MKKDINELNLTINSICESASNELDTIISATEKLIQSEIKGVNTTTRLNHLTLLHQMSDCISLRMITELYSNIIENSSPIEYVSLGQATDKCVALMQILTTFYQSVLPSYMVQLQQNIEAAATTYKKYSIDFIAQTEALKKQLHQ